MFGEVEQPHNTITFANLKLEKNEAYVDPECTEHMEAYKLFIKRYATLGYLFAQRPFYRWTPEDHFLYYYVCFILTFIWSGIFYSIFYHAHNGNYLAVMEPLAIVGVSSSVIGKILIEAKVKLINPLNFVSLRIKCLIKWTCQCRLWRMILSLFFFMRKLCYENVTGVRANIIQDGLKTNTKILNYFYITMLMSLLVFLSYPAYEYIYNHNIIPVMPIEYPYVDQVCLFAMYSIFYKATS